MYTNDIFNYSDEEFFKFMYNDYINNQRFYENNKDIFDRIKQRLLDIGATYSKQTIELWRELARESKNVRRY